MKYIAGEDKQSFQNIFFVRNQNRFLLTNHHQKTFVDLKYIVTFNHLKFKV